MEINEWFHFALFCFVLPHWFSSQILRLNNELRYTGREGRREALTKDEVTGK